jgi:hypothetical protein
MAAMAKRDPLDQAIRNVDRAVRNVKIATFLAALAACLYIADAILALMRR